MKKDKLLLYINIKINVKIIYIIFVKKEILVNEEEKLIKKKIFIITFLCDQNVTHHTLYYDEFTILMKNK